MRTFIITAIVSVAAATLGGCLGFNEPGMETSNAAAPTPAPQTGDSEYLSKAAVQNDKNSQNAVESAMVWSEKYSEAVNRLTALQDECAKLKDQMQKQELELVELRAQMKQQERELSDANTELIAARQDITKWKKDVLGFREEMRKAQQLELESIAKILKLLGAEAPEVATSAPAEKPAEPAAEKPAEPAAPAEKPAAPSKEESGATAQG